MAPHPFGALPPLKSCDCSLLFQDTISLSHLLQHLICFWWPCRDVAIHMGNWISPTLILSFHFPLSLTQTHTQTRALQLAEKDCFDWAIHVCWFKRLLRWLVILMDLLFSWENILISLCEITSHIYYSSKPCWFTRIIFIAFLIGFFCATLFYKIKYDTVTLYKI